jgi:hypothetical protein
VNHDPTAFLELIHIIKCLGFMYHKLGLEQKENGEAVRAADSLRQSRMWYQKACCLLPPQMESALEMESNIGASLLVEGALPCTSQGTVWADVCLILCKTTETGALKRQSKYFNGTILRSAAIHFLRIFDKDNTKGAYNLACAFARLGNEGKCKEWLELSAKGDGLSSQQLLLDEDMDTVRDARWFKNLANKVKQREEQNRWRSAFVRNWTA